MTDSPFVPFPAGTLNWEPQRVSAQGLNSTSLCPLHPGNGRLPLKVSSRGEDTTAGHMVAQEGKVCSEKALEPRPGLVLL